MIPDKFIILFVAFVIILLAWDWCWSKKSERRRKKEFRVWRESEESLDTYEGISRSNKGNWQCSTSLIDPELKDIERHGPRNRTRC